VGAPSFMRGKERFSAPGNSLDSILRFSAGQTTSGNLALHQGPTLHVAEKPELFRVCVRTANLTICGGSPRIHAGEGALQRSGKQSRLDPAL
jgi:hypothetical protein